MKTKHTVLSLAIMGVLSGTIHAQTANSTNNATEADSSEIDKDIEQIVVVGSNIRRSTTSFGYKQPVQIVGEEDFDLIGASQPVDILKELTVNTGSRGSDETGNSNGTSQINIRGLGFGSTLTLLNGRRAGISAISDTSGNDFVDINQFPLSAIKRIEVLTDGASAIYGSQAVAGVANIVTRKGFEGFEVSLDYRDSNTESSSISLAAGKAFENGQFNVYATYYNQESRYRGEIDFLDDRLDGGASGNPANGSLVSGTGSPGTYFRAFEDANGNLTRDPNIAARNANRVGDPDCIQAGGIVRPNELPADPTNLTGVTCRLSFFDQVSPIRDEERLQLFTEFEWEFSDDVTFFHENHFSFNLATGHAGPNFIGNGSATGGGWVVPGSHPFNFFVADGEDGIRYAGPDAFANDPNLQAVDIIATMRPFGAIAAGDNFASFQETYGNQERRSEYNYFRMVNGLEIELGGEGNWFASVSQSISINRFYDGEGNFYIVDRLDEQLRDGTFNPFGTAVVNPGLISPKDGASTAFNEPEDVALFNSRRNNYGRSREDVIDVLVSGDLFDTDFGMISAAFGGQYRDTSLDFTPDSLLAAGEGNDNSRDFVLDGEQDVSAFFAEAIMPFNDVAELQVAVRYEDYGGNIGSTTDPKIGLKVQPVDWVTLRSSWGTSFQAPTIRQTARAVSSGFIDDTCPGGVPASITILIEGSEDLGPQSAESFTLGAVFEVGEALFSVDAWSYDYEGVISPGQSGQAIVDSDCDDGVPSDPRVTRDAAGFIQAVTTSFENVEDVETSGIDVAFRYDIGAGDAGKFVVDSNISYLAKMDVIDRDGGVTDAVGSRNFRNFVGPQPQVRANGGVTWMKDNHAANLTLRYIDSYDNDQSNNAEIESYTTVDAQYSFTAEGLLGDTDTVFAIGVNNLFDQDPPALRKADSDGNIITVEDNPIAFVDRPGYDDRSGVNLLGRTLYLRLKQTF